MKSKLTYGKCPACGHALTKKYRRSLSQVAWWKLQSAYWMEAWNREVEKRKESSK